MRVAGTLLLAVAALAGEAQPPWLAYVHPAGGQRGTTVTVTVAGARIAEATGVLVSGEGVAARLVAVPAGPEGEQKPKKAKQTVMDEVGTVELAIAADAAPGERSLRLITPQGLTNPRVLCLGTLPEVVEPSAPRPGRPEAAAPPHPPIAVPELPAVLNGQIQLGETDRWSFRAIAGTRLVCAVAARSLVPYIADAVPGWAQPVVAIIGAEGRELPLTDLTAFRQDALVACTIPKDGLYTLAVRDVIWRGRPDFTYRISLGALPSLTGIHPLGAAAGGGPVAVQLIGENLPVASLPVSPQPGQRAIATPAGDWPFAVEDGTWFDGRLEQPGAIAEFPLSGRQGERIEVEVRARRLGSPLDARLSLIGPDGAVVAAADDQIDRAQGLMTHHADPELSCILPTDGAYRVRLTDALGAGGPAYSYRLRAGPPRPRLTLLAEPSSLALHPGGSVPVTVHVLRGGGCVAPVALILDGCPGVTLDAASVPPGVERFSTTLSAAVDATAGARRPRLVGTADGLAPVATTWADDQMQAFLWMQLVPAAEPALLVRAEAAPLRVRAVDVPPDGVPVVAGRANRIALALERGPGWDGPVRLQLHDPPPGVTLRSGRVKAGALAGVLELNRAADAAAPGGNLIVSATVTQPDGTTPEGKPKWRHATVWLPAIPLQAAP